MSEAPQSAHSRPQLLTLEQAAQVFAISRRTLERLIAGGDFPPPVKIGRASRVLASDVENYLSGLSQRRNGGPAQ
jgi:excisionase family DNA binding protein